MNPAVETNYTWEILRIFLYLGVIIFLIYLLNYFLRNYRRFIGGTNSQIKVIDRGYLNQKAQVSLIEVNGKYYLLGVVDDEITVIDTFSNLDSEEEVKTEQINPSFAEILKRKFFNKRGDGDA